MRFNHKSTLFAFPDKKSYELVRKWIFMYPEASWICMLPPGQDRAANKAEENIIGLWLWIAGFIVHSWHALRGVVCSVSGIQTWYLSHESARQTKNVVTMSIYCWTSVRDAGPTVKRHWDKTRVCSASGSPTGCCQHGSKLIQHRILRHCLHVFTLGWSNTVSMFVNHIDTSKSVYLLYQFIGWYVVLIYTRTASTSWEYPHLVVR